MLASRMLHDQQGEYPVQIDRWLLEFSLIRFFSFGMSRSAPDDLLVRPRLQQTWMNLRAKKKKIVRLFSCLKMSKHEWNKKCTTYGRTSNSPYPGTPWLNYLCFQRPLDVWGIECYVHFGHAAAGQRRAVHVRRKSSTSTWKCYIIYIIGN